VPAFVDDISSQEAQLLSFGFKIAPQSGQAVISTFFSQAVVFSN
jgi:hypothetical protein